MILKQMINKKILSEIPVYFGEIKMPNGFEIQKDEFVKNITLSKYYEDIEYPFSREWDKLKTFLTDFMSVEYNLFLIPKKTFGDFYEKNETSKPKLEINPVDLKNSCDFVFLYGVEIEPKTCEIIIYYDNNRRKGRKENIFLENNKFIMFPSSQMYYVKNIKNSYLNFTQTILFDFI
jgi:hypothetical protein